VYTFVINAHNGHGSINAVSVPVSVSRFPSMRQIVMERAPAAANAWKWFLRNSNTSGLPDAQFTYGNPKLGDYPVTGDWDGNGSATVGIVRPDASGHLIWYLRNANSKGKPSITPFAYGSAKSGDFPVVGDWTNSGNTTIGVARPSGGNIVWLLRNSNKSGDPDIGPFGYGTTDTGFPIPGDWDGTGSTTASFASIDLSNGHWSWNERNTNGGAETAVPFDYGNVTLGDHLVAGDWDGKNGTSNGVTRPDSQGHFVWLLANTNILGMPDVTSFPYGSARTDIPVTGDWNHDATETAGVVRGVKV
jgi:hypothetical protein